MVPTEQRRRRPPFFIDSTVGRRFSQEAAGTANVPGTAYGDRLPPVFSPPSAITSPLFLSTITPEKRRRLSIRAGHAQATPVRDRLKEGGARSGQRRRNGALPLRKRSPAFRQRDPGERAPRDPPPPCSNGHRHPHPHRQVFYSQRFLVLTSSFEVFWQAAIGRSLNACAMLLGASGQGPVRFFLSC